MIRNAVVFSAALLCIFTISATQAKANATMDASRFLDSTRADQGIQAAIDAAAAAGGGVVVLPEGRFPLACALEMRTGVTLRGQGEKTIRDNSRNRPGQFPGVRITAIWGEGNVGSVVRDNIIESTLEEPTQWIGIEEVHAEPRQDRRQNADPTTGLMLVDRSVIEGNRLSGHKTADIVVRGPNTVVRDNIGSVVTELPAAVAGQ